MAAARVGATATPTARTLFHEEVAAKGVVSYPDDSTTGMAVDGRGRRQRLRSENEMNEKQFMNAVANGRSDVLQLFLDALARTGADYCVIGGLAVNAYVEPVVSLDLDVVVAAGDVAGVCEAAGEVFRVERFPHSINLTSSESDLRIQLQTDPRYQDFIGRATVRDVLGYQMRVAALEDVLQGKVWACCDEGRRRSKRQKDLADISRLIEAYPELEGKLPAAVRALLA